jgi:hypothetical protein
MDLFFAKGFLWQTLPTLNLPWKKVYKFGQQNSVRVTVVATTTVERQKGRNIVSKLIQEFTKVHNYSSATFKLLRIIKIF